ncbi:hypothetical protein SUGI_0025210 [Cryptomeria japonica]|nr:hypothetical protein SUGI_0025210 [Cryptomeria japonica]
MERREASAAEYMVPSAQSVPRIESAKVKEKMTAFPPKRGKITRQIIADFLALRGISFRRRWRNLGILKRIIAKFL